MKAMMIGAVALLACCLSGFTGNDAPGSGDAEWTERLVGDWEGNVEGMRYTEEWRRVDAGTFEGVCTTWAGDKPGRVERARVTRFADQWLYLANPGGARITAFVRVSADADTWVFENKEHDFPKRIGYKLAGRSGLVAWIAGSSDDEGRMEFMLKRVK